MTLYDAHMLDAVHRAEKAEALVRELEADLAEWKAKALQAQEFIYAHNAWLTPRGPTEAYEALITRAVSAEARIAQIETAKGDL